ncbi:hypothetical protein GQ602_003822 [Ophiocordyceps camponoti-floridani]|uniref:Uncharacterized protein n=1 Tax=Ophiocordyceps camponoti-floridani TaxID=2030778 RepID=A0A8H4Q5K4_9HYPO|nr:hypothetical protein GQ602_003822 [Ophiocordyceps camponoti-floridani]
MTPNFLLSAPPHPITLTSPHLCSMFQHRPGASPALRCQRPLSILYLPTYLGLRRYPLDNVDSSCRSVPASRLICHFTFMSSLSVVKRP